MNRLSSFTGYPSLVVLSLMELIHLSSFLIARQRCVSFDEALNKSFFQNSTDSCRPAPPRPAPPFEVWQYLYFHSTGQEGHRLSWAKRQSIHSKWKTEGRQCGGDLLSSHDSMLWEGCHLRLPQRQVHGAEKGTAAELEGCTY